MYGHERAVSPQSYVCYTATDPIIIAVMTKTLILSMKEYKLYKYILFYILKCLNKKKILAWNNKQYFIKFYLLKQEET